MDHCLLVLASLLSPVAARQAFLSGIKPKFLLTEEKQQQQAEDNVWVVMGEDGGEEEEDISQTWSDLTEEDIIDVSLPVVYCVRYR